MQALHKSISDALGWLIDRLVTLVCWVWFIFGFLCCFSVPYALAAVLSKDSEAAFQRLNSRFFAVLFAILRYIAPSHRVKVDPDVSAIRSGVIICNHRSYLDPLLLIHTFPKHKTIVKARFFTMPIFGQILSLSGYIPAATAGRFSRLMLQQIDKLPSFFHAGGNLFVFPEGTRSRDGKVGTLHPGALKLARLCKVPIYVLRVTHTEVLFPPGRFVFNSRCKNTITLRLLGCINPDYEKKFPSSSVLEEQVAAMYTEKEP